MFVVNGEVYDGTAFLDEHPGGADSIWLAAGELDTTEDFIAIHSDDAKRKLVPVGRFRTCREGQKILIVFRRYPVPHWHAFDGTGSRRQSRAAGGLWCLPQQAQMEGCHIDIRNTCLA